MYLHNVKYITIYLYIWTVLHVSAIGRYPEGDHDTRKYRHEVKISRDINISNNGYRITTINIMLVFCICCCMYLWPVYIWRCFDFIRAFLCVIVVSLRMADILPKNVGELIKINCSICYTLEAYLLPYPLPIQCTSYCMQWAEFVVFNPATCTIRSNTRRRDTINDKCLFIVDCAVCWIEYCISSIGF
jgi:hypothetical protein